MQEFVQIYLKIIFNLFKDNISGFCE